jgi:hypothetical protein
VRPELPLGRFQKPTLAVPGVIGVLSYYDVQYVQLGPDAGWPVPQPMLDWSSDFLFVEKRALSLKARALLGRKLPDEALAEALALNADMASVDVPPIYEEAALEELRLAHSARLLIVPPEQHEPLQGQGVPVYRAGYSRVMSYLRLDIPQDTQVLRLWISEPDELFLYSPEAPPPSVSNAQFLGWVRALWIDRALRALTQGVISESAVHAARACDSRFWNRLPLLKDGALQAAMEAAAQMSAGAPAVTLPFHGRAVRLRLPPFEVLCESRDASGKPLGLGAQSPFTVPAEDAWLVTG